jgi:hypothetical protein
VKVKRYYSGSPEEFLKWHLILEEHVKNNGYTESPDNIMNLAHAMLAGRSLEAFLHEKRSQEAKNKVRKFKSPYSSCQFERLTSKVDGGMSTRGKEST